MELYQLWITSFATLHHALKIFCAVKLHQLVLQLSGMIRQLCTVLSCQGVYDWLMSCSLQNLQVGGGMWTRIMCIVHVKTEILSLINTLMNAIASSASIESFLHFWSSALKDQEQVGSREGEQASFLTQSVDYGR